MMLYSHIGARHLLYLLEGQDQCCRTIPPTLSVQFAGATGMESEMKYTGNADSGVVAVGGNSGASRRGENIAASTRSFQRPITPKKRVAGRLSQPANSDSAAAPLRNSRLFITSATLTSGNHREQRAGMR
jgi:hypothetical protein